MTDTTLSMVQALDSQEFHLNGCTRIVGPRGATHENIVKYRRNGRTQTWKTRPDEFRIPVTHGLKGYGQITHRNAAEFHTLRNCPTLNVCCTCNGTQHFKCFCKCHTS